MFVLNHVTYYACDHIKAEYDVTVQALRSMIYICTMNCTSVTSQLLLVQYTLFALGGMQDKTYTAVRMSPAI